MSNVRHQACKTTHRFKIHPRWSISLSILLFLTYCAAICLQADIQVHIKIQTEQVELFLLTSILFSTFSQFSSVQLSRWSMAGVYCCIICTRGWTSAQSPHSDQPPLPLLSTHSNWVPGPGFESRSSQDVDSKLTTVTIVRGELF